MNRERGEGSTGENPEPSTPLAVPSRQAKRPKAMNSADPPAAPQPAGFGALPRRDAAENAKSALPAARHLRPRSGPGSSRSVPKTFQVLKVKPVEKKPTRSLSPLLSRSCPRGPAKNNPRSPPPLI